MLGNSARSSLVCLSYELGFGFDLDFGFDIELNFDLNFVFNFVVWCLHLQHSMLKCGIAHAPKSAKDMRMR